MAKRSRTAAERAQQASRLRTRPARARLLAAARELASAHGYESIKVGDIATAAGVSRETFYTHFADKRSCLAEATDPRLGEIESELRIAAEREESWAPPVLAAVEDVLLKRYGSRGTPRGRIIEALLGLVAERGYASTRLIDVIKAAKVSYPSFYRHFASKEDCFAVACECLITRLAGQLETVLSDEAGQPARLVELAELLSDDPASARILALEADRLPRNVNGADLRGATALLVGLIAGPDSPEPATASPAGLAASFADSSRAMLAGAFLELLRRAVLRTQLDRLPADVAALAPYFSRPPRVGEGIGTRTGRRTHASRKRERRGSTGRPATATAGASR